ncbi:MAG: hypothetical protein GPJ54_00805 [Candidatus Heimdallarchaeota archaeon]|nr:hypothetical protein [Candidatus Heimdallarchaeota archaeon]
MNDNYSAKVQQLNLQLDSRNEDHPSMQFIKYGLKLLDYKLEGDAGVWDINRKNYLLEIGLTQNAFEEFCALDKHLVTIDWKFKPVDEPKILIFANFISNIVYSLVGKTGKKRDITILTHDLIHKDRAITYCELSRTTSKISKKIFALEEFEKNVKFDLIMVPNTLGFNHTVKENFTLLQSLSKSTTILYINAPTEAKYNVGIEPIYYLHPQFKGIPNTHEFGRQAKAAGWSQSYRTGSNKEILLLKQG